MSRHLDTVVELQRALKDLKEAQALHDTGPPEVRELHGEHRTRQLEIETLETRIEEADKRRRAAEAELEDAQAKLERYQEQINRVTTQREYGALLSEIDTVKEKIRSNEDEALAALEESEEAKGELDSKKESFSELDARYSELVAEWERDKPQVTDRIQKLEGTIEVLRERLPAPVLMQFERLFNRFNGEALAPISRIDTGSGPQIRHCSHCNYRIRPQIVVEIQTEGALISCDSCHRILYLADPQ